MNRLGRGYSFEALRAKILFTEGAHKQTLSRPKFERRREQEMQLVVTQRITHAPPGMFENTFPGFTKPPKASSPQKVEGTPKNYGPDINTLIQLLESGKL